jgi:hypothetical protein
MLEKDSPLGGLERKRWAPFALLIAIGVFLMVAAGLSFLHELCRALALNGVSSVVLAGAQCSSSGMA